MRPEFISIVVPTLNEEAYIGSALNSLALPDGEYEILVLDGGSTDRTVEIVELVAAFDPKVRLVRNPGRLQSCAMNLAARIADPRSAILVRADAHCEYPAGFARLVATRLRETGAQSVVVPMVAAGGETCFQSAVATAQNSCLGNGGAVHRRGGCQSGWVDHGHHAGFDRAFFMAIDGYDESFATNEDAEYDIRAHGAGGKVWMEIALACIYRPRKTVAALWSQYRRYGRGRAMTTLKHRALPKARQALPIIALVGCVSGLVAMPFSFAGLALPVGYAAACLLLGVAAAEKAGGGRCEAASGVAFAVMHIAWATGFIEFLLTSVFRDESR